jgi:long-chain acyl-CoA synthetase
MGFWAIAAENPARVAVVEPDGTEVLAGDLLALSNQLVHGLRELGLQPGDALAVVLPNGTDFLAAYLAATQAGWYLVPINHHLAGPEIAYILSDCDAKAVIGHERFADICIRAVEEAGIESHRCFSVGDIEGFLPFADLTDGRPDTTPPDRQVGAVMNYTSGTTGRPKGIRRPLMGISPEAAAFGCRSTTTCIWSALRSTTRRSWCSAGGHCTSGTQSSSWTSGRRRGCWSGSSATG